MAAIIILLKSNNVWIHGFIRIVNTSAGFIIRNGQYDNRRLI